MHENRRRDRLHHLHPAELQLALGVEGEGLSEAWTWVVAEEELRERVLKCLARRGLEAARRLETERQPWPWPPCP